MVPPPIKSVGGMVRERVRIPNIRNVRDLSALCMPRGDQPINHLGHCINYQSVQGLATIVRALGCTHPQQDAPAVARPSRKHRKQSNFHYIKCYGVRNTEITHRKSLILLGFQQRVNRPSQNTNATKVKASDRYRNNFFTNRFRTNPKL